MSSFLAVLRGERPSRRPLWIMRQAGRYLEEYRALRRRAGSFLELCDNSELAAEATLQPLRRFDLDAAILFADILLPVRALGQTLRFEEGEGPRLAPLEETRLRLSGALERLESVFDSARKAAERLEGGVPLIGFCGGPWTVASYMVEGRSASERETARRRAEAWRRGEDEEFGAVMTMLEEISSEYLAAQASAGADVLQIFESWAGDFKGEAFDRMVTLPLARVIEGTRRKTDVPIIAYLRGVDATRAEAVRLAASPDALSVDEGVSLYEMREFCDVIPMQGNLSPATLRLGGEAMERAIREIVSRLPSQSSCVQPRTRH